MNQIFNIIKIKSFFILAIIGSFAIKVISKVGFFSIFFYRSMSSIFSKPFYFRNTFDVINYAFIRGLPIVALAGFFVGGVIALQSYNGLSRFNAQDSIPAMIAISFARELGPVVAGFTLCGSIGASMAAELSGMVVNNQINAMRMLLVNPFKFLIVPNIIACLIVLPFLTFITDIIGFLGGFVVCVNMLNFSESQYINNAFNILKASDVIFGLVKSLFFGLAISILSCYHGYNSNNNALGIGKATISAVTTSSAAILIINYFLTAILF